MDRYIARQPILDARERVCAYELLYRSSQANFFTPGTDLAEASARTIHDGLFTFGLDALIGTKRVYVNVTKESLISGLPRVMPPDRTVVELLETVIVDDEVYAACRRLKHDGYQIALDDFEPRSDLERMYDLVDVIKVDFRLTAERRERAALVAEFGRRGITMLAEKVETREEFVNAVSDGYHLFQGYFFSKPEVMQQREIPANKVGHLRFLQQMQRPELDMKALERVISQEVSLSVKLLRYLNSAAFGLRFQVTSIAHALNLLGSLRTRQWASAIAVVSLGEDSPQVMVVSTLLRARLCEQLATGKLASRSGDMFLVGLLSTIDVLLRRPLRDILRELPLAPDLVAAVLEGKGPLGELLCAVRAWETGLFDEAAAAVQRAGVTVDDFATCYTESIAWAESLVT